MNGRRVPTPVLFHWYTCGRKEPIATEVIAHLYAPDKHAYPCPHGDHWHVGRAVKCAETHAHRQTRRNNARKAWDQQAYEETA